jgi:hypothetical protein
MGNVIEMLKDEQVVLSSENDSLILTTKRVRYKSEVWGSSELASMTLNSVASCVYKTKSYPIILIMAAIVVVYALAEHGRIAPYLFFISVILIAIYFATRQAVLLISSDGGEAIVAPVKGMGQEKITKFVDALENEKLK